MKTITPTVGNWYKELQQGSLFEVVAIDENEQTINTQLLDGAIGEYDQDSWQELLLEEVAAPEDWRNAYELSQEDYLDPDATICPENWNNPINSIETDIVNGLVDEL